jgi:23S rRNA (guanine745-N1)-methyltransferase
VCGRPLSRLGPRYTCDQRHSFDVAREGYVNLLRAGQRRSRGDTVQMLRARRAFLSEGYYDRLADRLSERLLELAQIRSGDEECRVLDVGCGEGFFLRQIGAMADQRGVFPISRFGVDVSRGAVRLAARADQEATFAVGTVH